MKQAWISDGMGWNHSVPLEPEPKTPQVHRWHGERWAAQFPESEWLSWTVVVRMDRRPGADFQIFCNACHAPKPLVTVAREPQGSGRG